METIHGGLNGGSMPAMASMLGADALAPDPVPERTPPFAVHAVPTAQLDTTFPAVLPWIVAALDHSVSADIHPGMVWERIRSGDYLLLVMTNGEKLCGAAVLNRGYTRQGRVFIGVVACGGTELEGWLHLLVAEVKRLARAAGGAQVLILGRPGWSRLLANHGTSVRAVVLACDDIGE